MGQEHRFDQEEVWASSISYCRGRRNQGHAPDHANRLDHMRRGAKPGHSRRGRAAKDREDTMLASPRRQGVKLALHSRKRDGQEPAPPWQAPQAIAAHCVSRIAHACGLSGSHAGDCSSRAPPATLEENLAPIHGKWAALTRRSPQAISPASAPCRSRSAGVLERQLSWSALTITKGRGGKRKVPIRTSCGDGQLWLGFGHSTRGSPDGRRRPIRHEWVGKRTRARPKIKSCFGLRSRSTTRNRPSFGGHAGPHPRRRKRLAHDAGRPQMLG